MTNDADMTANMTLAILAGGEGSRMGLPKGNLEVAGAPILTYLLDRLCWPGPTLLVTAPGREHPPGWKAFHREVVDPVAGLGPLRGVLTAIEAAPTDHLVVMPLDMPGLGGGHLQWLVSAFLAERSRRRGLAGLMTSRHVSPAKSRLSDVGSKRASACHPERSEGSFCSETEETLHCAQGDGSKPSSSTGRQGEAVSQECASIATGEVAARIEPFPAVFHRRSAMQIRRRLDASVRSVHALSDEPGFVVIPAPPSWAQDTWINLNRPADFQAFLNLTRSSK